MLHQSASPSPRHQTLRLHFVLCPSRATRGASSTNSKEHRQRERKRLMQERRNERKERMGETTGGKEGTSGNRVTGAEENEQDEYGNFTRDMSQWKGMKQ